MERCQRQSRALLLSAAKAIDSRRCETLRWPSVQCNHEGAMIGRITLGVGCLLVASLAARAQDVPGIEICTVEKTMERRTSCLQSNVDFLMKTIGKLNGDHQLKLDVALRQIEMLKAAVSAQQKTIDQLKAAQAKAEPAKDASVKDPSIKDGSPKDTPAAKDVAK
jgi:hypothetical protein